MRTMPQLPRVRVTYAHDSEGNLACEIVLLDEQRELVHREVLSVQPGDVFARMHAAYLHVVAAAAAQAGKVAPIAVLPPASALPEGVTPAELMVRQVEQSPPLPAEPLPANAAAPELKTETALELDHDQVDAQAQAAPQLHPLLKAPLPPKANGADPEPAPEHEVKPALELEPQAAPPAAPEVEQSAPLPLAPLPSNAAAPELELSAPEAPREVEQSPPLPTEPLPANAAAPEPAPAPVTPEAEPPLELEQKPEDS